LILRKLLSESERTATLYESFLTQYCSVTDGWTDGKTISLARSAYLQMRTRDKSRKNLESLDFERRCTSCQQNGVNATLKWRN